MDYKLKQPLLWLGTALLLLPFVHAALPQMLQPIVDLFGGMGFAGIYTEQTALLWDSILAAVIFIGLSTYVFGKRFGEGKALPITIGLVLAIGFVIFELNTGFRLAKNLAGPAFFVMYGFFVFLLYALANKFISNKAVAFMLAFVIMYMFIPPAVHSKLQEMSNVNAILALLFAISIIGLLIGIFSLIWKKTTGRSLVSSSGSGPAARTTSDVLREEGKIAKEEKKQTERERKREAANAAAEAAKADLKITLPELEHRSLDALEAGKRLEQLLSTVNSYAETVNDRVQEGLKQGMDLAAYRSQVAGYQAQLDPYFLQMQEAVRAMQVDHEAAIDVARTLNKLEDQHEEAAGLDSREAGRRDSNFLKRFVNRRMAGLKAPSPFAGVRGRVRRILDYFEIRLQVADKTTDAIKYLYAHEARIKIAFEQLLDEYKRLAATGADLGEVDKRMSEIRNSYEQYHNRLQQVRIEHEALLKQVKPVRDKANQLLGMIDEAESASERIPGILSKLMSDVAEYRKDLYTFMGNPKKWRSARNSADDALKRAREIIELDTRKVELIKYTTERLEELTVLDQQNAPVIKEFADKVHELVSGEAAIVSRMLSTEILVKAVGLYFYSTENKITEAMGDKFAYEIKPDVKADAYVALTPDDKKKAVRRYRKRVNDHIEQLFKQLDTNLANTNPGYTQPFEIMHDVHEDAVKVAAKVARMSP